MTDPDVSAKDALQVAQRALSKVNEHDDHADRIDELEERIVALELRLSEHDEQREYRSLTLDEKVGMVREHAFEKAAQGRGTATLDYDDIMWEVFGGDPSADHCYKLMRLAADARGFTARDPDGGSKHLAVDAAEAKRSVAFSSANKTSQEDHRA